ncbi:hypothetical protein QTG54_010382 [Skeletonema marinoi]|uniref:Uncharacterized protein n=1 Tax=Skeletonema marinoi TaxID=267567 RepID=A0AAD8Y5A6_9STRA|nr:hypothetical protein QTG54_010382 [Skeletonema marinoi]
MNFATASLYLTAVLTSGFATIGEARLLSKAAKSQACQEALNGFNLAGEINFGSGDNGYTRTMCAGNTFLLTNPEKASKIYEYMCDDDGTNADGFAALDAFLLQADEAGGCDDPVAGQPSRALAEYRKCRKDAKVATDMVCTDAGEEEGDLCWSVVYQLTKDACWSSDYTEPILDDNASPSNCLPLREKTEVGVPVHVTCDCLSAYVDAYEKFSPEGLASFGADEHTLALVKNRLLNPLCQT